MSKLLESYIWQHADYSGNDLLLLIACADWADDAGFFFPSYRAIARKIRCSENTALRLMKKFINEKAITREHQFIRNTEANRSNLYQLHIDQLRKRGGSPIVGEGSPNLGEGSPIVGEGSPASDTPCINHVFSHLTNHGKGDESPLTPPLSDSLPLAGESSEPQNQIPPAVLEVQIQSAPPAASSEPPPLFAQNRPGLRLVGGSPGSTRGRGRNGQGARKARSCDPSESAQPDTRIRVLLDHITGRIGPQTNYPAQAKALQSLFSAGYDSAACIEELEYQLSRADQYPYKGGAISWLTVRRDLPTNSLRRKQQAPQELSHDRPFRTLQDEANEIHRRLKREGRI